jgi:hypothetical protein
MVIFSRVTTILIFILLCYALVTRGIEFISIAAEKIRKLQTPSGREKRINPHLVGKIYREPSTRPNKFHLTQRLVNTFVRLTLYSVIALLISLGVDAITRPFEPSLLLRWLLNFIIIALIWVSPYEIQRIKRTNISGLPISICWIVSVLYGSLGLSLLTSPELWIYFWIFIDIFWLASITTLKLMLFLHLVLSQISPWYQSLPKA